VTREKHDRSWWLAVLVVAVLILAIPACIGASKGGG